MIIDVLIVKPHEKPVREQIGNDLKSMQAVVGGLIQVFDIEPYVSIVCNEEGKLMQLEGNRGIGNDIIAGTFFIAGYDDEGDFISLTKEQTEKYEQRFLEPEFYTTGQVEDAIFIEVTGFSPEELFSNNENDEGMKMGGM